MKRCCTNSATVWAESVASTVQRYPRLFVKKPPTVSLDLSISSDAVRLYDILVIKNYKKGNRTDLVDVTTRGLAILLARNPSTISRWLKQLQGAGHIEKLSKPGVQSLYRLLSPVFRSATRVETAPGAIAELNSTELPMIRDKRRLCPKCKRVRSISSTSGVCAACLEDWAKRSA